MKKTFLIICLLSISIALSLRLLEKSPILDRSPASSKTCYEILDSLYSSIEFKDELEGFYNVNFEFFRRRYFPDLERVDFSDLSLPRKVIIQDNKIVMYLNEEEHTFSIDNFESFIPTDKLKIKTKIETDDSKYWSAQSKDLQDESVFGFYKPLFKSSNREIDYFQILISSFILKLQEVNAQDPRIADFQKLILKGESLKSFLKGDLDYLPLSALYDNYFSTLLPKYYYAESARYSPIRDIKLNGVEALFVDATRMRKNHKFDLKNIFYNFLLASDKSFIMQDNAPYFLKNFTYYDDERPQASFHIVNFLNQNKFESNGSGIDNIGKSIREFISKQYKERLGINDTDLSTLLKISEEMEPRSISFISTKQGILDFSYEREGPIEKPLIEIFRKKHVEEFDVNASITAVISNGKHEKLPLEAFTGEVIERKFKDERIVEIGRFSVPKKGIEFSSIDFITAIGLLAKNIDDIDRLIIEADFKRARIFKKFGFKPIKERINYEGNKEYIMEVDPDTLRKSVFPK